LRIFDNCGRRTLIVSDAKGGGFVYVYVMNICMFDIIIFCKKEKIAHTLKKGRIQQQLKNVIQHKLIQDRKWSRSTRIKNMSSDKTCGQIIK
jgi:hypothetical protein